MVKIMALTVMEDFTYKEGKAIFATLADMMEHIDKTKDQMSDTFDEAYLESRLQVHLGEVH